MKKYRTTAAIAKQMIAARSNFFFVLFPPFEFKFYILRLTIIFRIGIYHIEIKGTLKIILRSSRHTEFLQKTGPIEAGIYC